MSAVWISKENWLTVWNALKHITIRQSFSVKTAAAVLSGSGPTARINIDLPQQTWGAVPYDGPFAVRYKVDDSGKEDRSTLAINAGHILCNGVYFECPEDEIGIEEGYLCLHVEIKEPVEITDKMTDEEIAEAQKMKINEPEYSIEEKPDDDYFPIAEIRRDEDAENEDDALTVIPYYVPVAIFMITHKCPLSETVISKAEGLENGNG